MARHPPQATPLRADPISALADLQTIASAIDRGLLPARAPELFDRLLEVFDLAPHLLEAAAFDFDGRAAGASELVVRLELVQPLRDLAAAVRALDWNVHAAR